MGGGCSRCCASCVSCCYGCRRHRSYTQKMTTKTAERVWFCVMAFTFLATLANMFLWVSSDNDADSVNAGFWKSTGVWFPFYFTFQIISYVTFAYVMLLMLFGFLHMALVERLQLHMIHKIGVVMSLVMTITLLVFVSIRLRHLWHFVPELLEYIGPFLQLVAVAFLTIMSWFVAGSLSTLQRRAGIPFRDASFWYFLVLIGLYITPIFIESPCIMTQHHEDNPPKPLLFAHRGAEEIAPENTNISFMIALDDYDAYGIKTDVRISFDGVPYVFHDEILTRTTNAIDTFPENYRQPADMFTMDELRELDAGSWFARKKPFLTAWFISDEEKEEFSQQGILTMVEMFELVLARKKSLLFDLRPPPSEHPYATSWLNTTIDVITTEIGLDPSEFTYWESPDGPHYVFFIQLYDNRTIQNVYNDIAFESVRSALENNVSTNVWTVNEAWLFQYYWCAGASSVTTSSIHTLSGNNSLVWQLTPTHYLIMWILFDIASFIWVIVVFVIQITRKRSKRVRRFPMSSLH
ncbi:glycerophosphodiester phosphodiesterase domain-containing protein 5-like isoform X2 [Lytechinus variegatus]|uniref:glycerophosphodiester phosphodiesterase domain-containing protein 5-like isoform X2 n=1 Tax=Lytechinus variegatus TaxID=7654 RepID=UPI001BB1AE4A|nr:glycerophosphodiester phosphodiesterase domain-containing protein 5-like isoform X2 [Lytechinus variegatus]XP_041482567.1 glycerophosphodiester phosphodiesterase domain-containing protein 5-like isoform X2 [Lytechinus variegatus]XP_041482718.1 glycerophosphodiester phosphodiesterase domain-containing protein 5-like isoform X2 [Lytechinus variegatus]XP_041482719.1 glycerophosphodiester phosphodiesterase domain-containing protein 5-like isoform X2 [Lytechinus variegatus]